MSATLNRIYAPVPTTERGKAVVLGRDPKLKNFIYAAGSGICIRDIKNPEVCDIYTEHNATTTVAKYAPSGFYIASGDVNGNVRIWDTVNKEHIIKFELRALGGRINDLDWTEDSKRIVCVGEGREFFGKAFMFDTGASVGEISGCSKNQLTCSIKQSRPYRLAIGGEDCDIQHFNGVPFKWQKRAESKAQRFVNTIRYSPNGEKYAVGSSDKFIQLYDGKSGDRLGELPVEHTGSIFSLSWFDDGSKLLSASGDKTCKLWDVEAQKCISTFTFGEETEDQQVGTLCQGEWNLSVSLSGNINYLDLNNPSKPTRVLYGHQKSITAMSYDAEKKEFYTGSYDSVITRWEEDTGVSHGFSGKGHTSQVNALAVQNGNLVTAAVDGTLRVTDLGSMEYGASFGTDTDGVGVAVGTANKSLVFGACLDGIVRIASGGDAASQIKKTATKFPVSSIALSKDDKLLAVGSADKSIHIFSVSADGEIEEVHVLAGHRGKVNQLEFSPNGKYLASCCQQRDIIIWNLSDWSIFTKAWGSFHTANITCLSWNPNSEALATGGLDQYLFVWSLTKKTKRIKVDRAHQGGVTDVFWTSESQLSSVGQDNALKTWNVTLH